MSCATTLRCRRCAEDHPLEPAPSCARCGGALAPRYDLDRARESLDTQAIAARRGGIWRYEEVLPVADPTGLGGATGGTPLLRAPRLGRRLGLSNLHLKVEGASHPTASFKDRPVAVAVAAALRFAYRIVATPSTGNLANAVAAFARIAGLEHRAFVPEDLEETKVAGTAVFGPGLVRVRGSYDDARRLAAESAKREGWAIVNVTLRPFYGEGSKTIAFEIAEQLGLVPRQVILPMGSGLLLDRVDAGFREWIDLGLSAGPPPRIFGVQAEGCSPIVRAFEKNEETLEPVRPRTIARSIAIGDPVSAREALAAIRSSGGSAVAVPESEIVDGIRALAYTEGTFGETACGVTVAGAGILARRGDLDADAPTVLVLTGSGWKTAEALAGALSVPLVDPLPGEERGRSG